MAQPLEQPSEVDWWHQVPPVLWPVPVAEASSILGYEVDLNGSRVVVGETEDGLWSYEQRAISKIHAVHGVDHIGVIPEVDWYRRQRDNTYLLSPRAVPVSRVYLELATRMDPHSSPILPDQSDLRPECRARSLVEHPNSPTVRWPRRASEQTAVTGARCWVLSPDGALSGYRALGEPRRREVGTIDLSQGLDGLDKPLMSTVIPLYSEYDWYRWGDTGDISDAVHLRVESLLVFLE